MESKHYSALFSFIWSIANDVLVHAFEKGDYKKIILPFMVLRRIDVLLEPTKAAVLEKKDFCDNHKITDYTPFLTQVTGYPFYNTSAFTMKTLKNEVDPQRLKMNVIEYFNGFSQDVQDIIDKFKLRQQVDNLTETGRLGSLLEKFTDESINLSILPVMEEQTTENGTVEMIERLPGLDNHSMGTIFEELLRKFNEENNVTEAGEHFTPRDYVHLLGELAVEPIKDKLADSTYTIYDGACGTGGILTITKEEFERVAQESGKQIKASIFGQELQSDTYATCKADLMISGNINKFTYRLGTIDHDYIAFGSTISQDGHAGEKFDFCISNPPFGTPWKEDLKNWGLENKKEIVDPRFFDGSDSFIPDISDCQMLFLANNLSRMKNDTPLGTRIVEVHNGSSLFTGSAGGGESNLRKYIIENDLLEAIIAMPEKDFYNTGIATYIWVITNRKEERRKGYVQLIDASNICTPLRKNLGEKNCETTEADRKKILRLLTSFEETAESKIFRNEEFGYWQVPILRPKRDEQGEIVLKKGKPVMVCIKKEAEQIPLLYEGGIEAFYENEVKPYDAEAVFGEPIVGYELSFTKYFYKPVQLRPLEEIMADINVLEAETDGLWADLLK
jgi:N-6 DNA methylase